MSIRAVILGLSFALFWSSAFTSARIIVAQAPPLASLSLRFLVSGIIGIAIARALGQSWHLTRGQWWATVIFGVCQNALYLGLFFTAMQTIEAGLASIMASAMPLIVALANRLVFGERLSWMAVVGLALGIGGVLIIMGSRLSGGADPFGIVLCILGTLALAIATLSARGASSGGNVLMVVGLQMLIGSAFLAVPAAILEPMEVTWSWSLILAFLYTTLVPGLLATWIWFTLVNDIGAIRASVFHFLNPFFGVAIAAVILGEALGPQDVLGVAIVAAGILLVQLSRAQKAG
ncbi:peptide ABC transporter permease [Oceanicola sp. 22II-s10i]|uniref:DMT family transporter n=1 Tax=Oceanicola sp. 22II-s10i TaxID=1317116 RepID=UPI000B528087|nr:DMT family transporter [Oceanicola sp. 22II-s10i]OWU86784.1 peptide ABC transporter permease [Oceanicola sp. 22II-s10i]